MTKIDGFEFDKNKYFNMIDDLGLNKTWDLILEWLKEKTIEEFENYITPLSEIGRLYEMGLAYHNKVDKKKSGIYYTNKDVSKVMASLFIEDYDGEEIADVGCGCGNLITEVLLLIKNKDESLFRRLLDNRMIYLYDNDKIALKICIAKISKILNENIKEKIRIIDNDFLDKEIILPLNINVITNPPYSQIKEHKKNWINSEAFKQSNDLYVGFMEKILDKSRMVVIVSPQSFLVGNKYSILREKLGKKFEGEIYSFDNVPGCLFSGKKEGIFNSNTSNSVRASITKAVKSNNPGFRLTHLIRFKPEQRNSIINIKFLKSKLGNKKQNLELPLKCHVKYENLIYNILDNEHFYIRDLLTEKKEDTNFVLYVSSSARYYTVCSKKKLNRTGVFEIYPKDLESLKILYTLLTSSYCYFWWRMVDGGIMYTKSTLVNTPINEEIKRKANNIDIYEVILKEKDFLVYKNNAGKLQESIKFPEKIRNKINSEIFNDIDFEIIHRNYEAY